MDNLEKYIKEHRAEFDSEEPSKEVWNGISDEINNSETKTIPFTSWMWKAAAIVLLATTTILLVDKFQTAAPVLVANEEEVFSEEFLNAEQYYLNQIDDMQTRLMGYSQDEVVSTQFLEDLAGLDSLYHGLKDEFKANGNNEQIADALIQNLRIRMEIINQQLMILERIKQKSDENIQI